MADDPLWAPTVPVDADDRVRSADVTPAHGADRQTDEVDAPTVPVGVPLSHGRKRTAVMPAVDVPSRSTAGSVASGRVDDGGGRSPRPRRRRRRRLGLWSLAVVVVLGAGYFAVSLLQVWSTGRSHQARDVDAIVVLGAAQYNGFPSPQLQARLDEVVRLWPQGYAPIVVVTGGKQPADGFTEAEASARYLVQQGIPESAIVYENDGTSTFESLQATAGILGERGLDRVLLVTDPFHSLRSRLIAEEVGLEAYVAPTSTSVLSGSRSAALHVKEAGGVAIGRVIGFGRLSGLTG